MVVMQIFMALALTWRIVLVLSPPPDLGLYYKARLGGSKGGATPNKHFVAVPVWWNWYTRRIQNPLPRGVAVRVRPLVPFILKADIARYRLFYCLFNTALHAEFRTNNSHPTTEASTHKTHDIKKSIYLKLFPLPISGNPLADSVHKTILSNPSHHYPLRKALSQISAYSNTTSCLLPVSLRSFP